MSPLPLPSGVLQKPVSLMITFTPHPLQAAGAAVAFLVENFHAFEVDFALDQAPLRKT